MTGDILNVQIDRLCLKTTVICSSVLLFKMAIANVMIGGARIKAGTRPPEDEALFPNKGKQSFLGRGDEKENKEAKENEQRLVRIGLNDLENIPIGLILCWGSLLVCKSTNAHFWLTICFTAGRVLHHITYFLKLQPWRAIAWGIAFFSMLGFAVNGFMGAIQL